jgi:hypothetical protein
MFKFSKQHRQLAVDISFFMLEKTAIVVEVTDVEYKHIPCPLCDRRVIARVGSTSVRFARAAEMTDFSGTANGLITRQSVFQQFTENRISGWRQGILSVEMAPEVSHLNADYDELIIIGSTRRYAEVVGLKVEQECRMCGYIHFRRPKQGLEMPLECWDGSDIFVIEELPGLYVVTDVVRKVIEENGFTGVRLVPSAKWEDPLQKPLVPVRYYAKSAKE